MEVIFDNQASFSGLENNVTDLVRQGFKTIMVFHAEGGIDQVKDFKAQCDALLQKARENEIQIFGGIFPGIVDNGRLFSQGSLIAGIESQTHVITLDNLSNPLLLDIIDQKLTPIQSDLRQGRFKTLMVIADGFGESNYDLVKGLDHILAQYPMNIVGGLAGRNQVKASLYNIFTPEKIIQNGAVLAFTRLESGIGVNHGWQPLEKTECTITRTNHCYVETINDKPALQFYLDLISKTDKAIAKEKKALLSGDANLIFNAVAIKYPLGLIRKTQTGATTIIDRTPVSVGADMSLQFSAEIPKGTRACILCLKGNTSAAQCLKIKEAAQSAYVESLRRFPDHVQEPRVFIMDCFGRKQMVEQLGQDFETTEFDVIAADQKEKPHSPMGVLTFGELSGTPDLGVELHNKTAVVATLEDR